MSIRTLLNGNRENKTLLYELITKHPNLFLQQLHIKSQLEMSKELHTNTATLSVLLKVARILSQPTEHQDTLQALNTSYDPSTLVY